MRIAFFGNFRTSYSSENHHAASLRQLGHEVIELQETQHSANQVLATALASDMLVWVHTHGWDTPGMDHVLATLRQRGIPSVTYHLDLWLGLRREADMRTDPYWNIEHFFTADPNMAYWLNLKTPVKGHYLPAGVLAGECYMASPQDRFDIAFVGSKTYHPEWPYRPKLIDFLHSTYGAHFRHYGGDGLGVKRGHDLNQVYADARVVVGDSLCLNFSYEGYFSDRPFETLGRGGFIIMPRVPGLDQVFTDGIHMAMYDFGDFDQLRDMIEHYLVHDNEREKIQRQGHEFVRDNHTYVHRWHQIIEEVS